MVNDAKRSRGIKDVQRCELSAKKEDSNLTGLTPRVVVISIILMLGIAFMVTRGNGMGNMIVGLDTAGVPSATSIAVVLIMMGGCELLRRIKCKSFMGLKRAEIVLLYIIISVGGLLVGVPLVGIFPFTIMSMRYRGDIEPGFWLTYSDQIPSFVIPTSGDALYGFYLGGTHVPWKEWMLPIIMWGLFYAAILFVLMCMATLVRERWIDHERLIFPLNLPILAMTEEPKETPEGSYFGPLWKNKYMWMGAVIPCVINTTVILNRYLPVIPGFPGMIRFGQFFTEEPYRSAFNHVPALDLFLNPLTVGIGYFVPLDLTFTFWLTYLLGQMGSRVVGQIYGNVNFGVHFQYLHGSGVWGAIALVLIWRSRDTIKDIIIQALKREKVNLGEENVPMSYNSSLIGGALAFLFIVLFSIYLLGFAPFWAVAFWSVFFIYALTFARMRAEAGLPTNSASVPEFKMNVSWAYGSDRIASSAIPMTFGHVLHYFAAMTGYTVEGYKFADECGIKRKSIVAAISLASLLAWFFGLYAVLPMIYERGAFAMDSFLHAFPHENFASGASIVTNSYPGSVYAKVFLYTGFAIGVILMIMRAKFLWWPLHPIGYAGVWQTGVGWGIWGPFLIVWFVKLLIMRYGGNSLYQKLKPFFLSLIIGTVVMQIISSVVAVIFGSGV